MSRLDPADTAGTLLPMPRVTPPTSDLSGTWIVPPMSVLDRRSGRWKARAAQWRALGITSELGRSEGLVHPETDYLRIRSDASSSGTSIFDPVLAEIAYRWYSREGDRVLDPFAGGSVRGVVASSLGRWYTGLDLRPEQVEANRAQADLGGDMSPEWICADSTTLPEPVGPAFEADLLFTCPPYGDLERYSDDPADLSVMPWAEFLDAYRTIIRESVALLRPDRFAAIVVSDIRDPAGAYRGLPWETMQALADSGAAPIGDIVVLDPMGSKQMLAHRGMTQGRLVQRVHQYLIVAVKGDRRRASQRLADVPREEAS